jgi:hypothetical protein
MALPLIQLQNQEKEQSNIVKTGIFPVAIFVFQLPFQTNAWIEPKQNIIVSFHILAKTLLEIILELVPMLSAELRIVVK